jgi:hypothetical protein
MLGSMGRKELFLGKAQKFTAKDWTDAFSYRKTVR